MPQAIAIVFGNIALSLTAGSTLAASAAAFAAATAIGSFVGGALVTGALSLGANLISGALAGKSGAVNAPEVRGSVRQAVPPHRIPYGYVRVGGALFFLDFANPPWLYVGLLLAARRIDGIDRYYVGETEVSIGHDRGVLTSPYVRESDGQQRLFISFRDGDPDQAIDPILLADFPDIDPGFRQRGHATIVFKARYGTDIDDFQAMWGQTTIPNMLFDVRGAGVHDPRDPTSDVDDPTTWPFRNTASLIQADWLRQPYGGRLPTSKIRWDEIADAANYDDELVGLKAGGFQKRYTIDGLVTLDQEPLPVMQAMLTANRGFIANNQGRVWVTSSPPLDPIMTIDDSMLHGGFEYRASIPKKQLVNKVRTRFTSADREYNLADGPVIVRSDLVALDGEALEATIALPFTEGATRAQRIADLMLENARLGRSLSAILPLRAIGLNPGKIVQVDSTIYPMMNGTYQIQTIGYNEDYSARPVVLTEYNKALAGEWNPTTDELPFELAEVI